MPGVTFPGTTVKLKRKCIYNKITTINLTRKKYIYIYIYKILVIKRSITIFQRSSPRCTITCTSDCGADGPVFLGGRHPKLAPRHVSCIFSETTVFRGENNTYDCAPVTGGRCSFVFHSNSRFDTRNRIRCQKATLYNPCKYNSDSVGLKLRAL